MKKRLTYGKFIIWLLLCVYVLTPFRIALPYLSYKINYQYISTTLCENKAKPALQCNGKCHLKKELKKALEEESEKKEISQKTMEVESLPVTFDLDFSLHLLFSQKLQFPQFTESFKSASPENTPPPPRA